MADLNCVLVLKAKDGTIAMYYPFTRWRNILDAPDVATIETTLNGHIGNTDIHVTAEQIGNLNTAIAGLIAHTEDGEIHVTAADKTAWNAAATAADKAAADASDALNTVAGLDSRVARLEDGLFNNITGNPYLVSFDALDGVVVTKGVWNENRQRIEC
jgi:hypothetical protein